ncbi:MAG TPA: orotate phosphoribosyltransferase [Candidatus Binataceae bacterium]|nr:orotate phosphoribosyltransferase [Candidatus Binataceae bacterium]
MKAERQRLAELLRATSLKLATEPVFRLASGKMSRYYVDCKQALSDPEARALIGNLAAQMIDARGFDAVGGLELGAYPIAIAISDAIFRTSGVKLRVFVVRKEPKTHGIKDLIAGNVAAGDRALIVDDVVTTAGSTIKAIRGARAAGLVVARALALIDREEEQGAENLAAESVAFVPLFTLRELLDPPG